MRFVRVIVGLIAVLPLLTSDVFAAAGTKLTVQVNSADTGKPIDRASVIVRFRHGLNPIKMKKIQTNWETKTSQEGTVSIPEIPMGEVEIQVIAKYYQTSGGIYQLDQPEQTVKIKLNSPQTQYSEDSKTK
jgi:5-hydroxyisourate hydrolase-like protein (transthyretin family)